MVATSFITLLPPLPRATHRYGRATAPPAVTCVRSRRRKRGPTPVTVRPCPQLPISPTPPVRHTRTAVSKPVDTVSARTVMHILAQRQDVLILTEASKIPGGVATALACRENTEHAVIIASKRDDVLAAALETRAAARGAVVIVAAGSRVPGSWRNPAMNANSSKKAVIVVATPRALFSHFLLNGHGRSWLKKPKLLVMLDPVAILTKGAKPQLSRVIRALTPTERRKNVVFVSRSENAKIQRDAVFLAERMVRRKRRVVIWDDDSSPEDAANLSKQYPDAFQHETEMSPFINHDGIDDCFDDLWAIQSPKVTKSPLVPDKIAPGIWTASKPCTENYTDCVSTDISKPCSSENTRESSASPLSESVPGETEINSSQPSCSRLMVGNWASLYEALRDKLRSQALLTEPCRTIVMFPSARLLECYATMCRVDGLDVVDVHRRSSASKREQAFEWLHQTEKAILFSSDVVIDGVLPKIAQVIMVGLPTGGFSGYERRARIVDPGGEVWVMMGHREVGVFEDELRVAGVQLQRSECTGGKPWSGDGLDMTAKSRAYLSWTSALLYERNRLGWIAKDVVSFVNEWATQLFGDIPEVPNRIVKNMPIKRIEGLRVVVTPPKVRPPTFAKNTTRKPKNRFKIKPKDKERLRKLKEFEENAAKRTLEV